MSTIPRITSIEDQILKLLFASCDAHGFVPTHVQIEGDDLAVTDNTWSNTLKLMHEYEYYGSMYLFVVNNKLMQYNWFHVRLGTGNETDVIVDYTLDAENIMFSVNKAILEYRDAR